MQKLLITVLILSISQILWSQQTNQSSRDYDYYWAKHKTQNKTGLIILGGGVTSLGAFGLWFNRTGFITTQAEDAGQAFLFFGGLAAVVTSIPFFIAAGNNKMKASRISIDLRMEKTYAIQYQKDIINYYPALSLRFSIK